ncbi:phosphate ABC transporter, permease protein PstA, partial [Staphylococcus epidermidis]
MSTHSNTANKTLIDKDAVEKNISSRDRKNSVNKWLFLLCTLIGLIVLVALLIQTFVKGAGHLTPEFFTNFSSSTPADAGIKGALVGSIWLILSIIPISIILGIGTEIFFFF